MHLVAWEDICIPKKFGGLGINRICNVNKLLSSKWLWRFGQQPKSLWHQVIANKYGLLNNWESKNPTLSYGCSCWIAIMNGLVDFKKCIMIDVGSGSKSSFWKDCWCMLRPLMQESPHMFHLARDKEVKVDY